MPSIFEDLPSLRGFEPVWFTGGPTRYYLPLIYDLVGLTRPKSVVTLRFGDGQAHFTFCQAAQDAGLTTRCLAVRGYSAESEAQDEAWTRGLAYGEESYGEASTLVADSRSCFAPPLLEGGIDFLWIDEIDLGTELEAVLSKYEPALSRDALVLFHGLSLERRDAPRPVWEKWAAGRRTINFAAGLGLGVASASRGRAADATRYEWLFRKDRAAELGDVYILAAELIEARKRAAEATRDRAALAARQVWLDVVLAESREAQRLIAHQAEVIATREPEIERLRQVTAAAQEIERERDQLKLQIREQKEILRAAKNACRKKGRCFQPAEERARKKRPIPERILREIKRLPRNLRRRKPAEGSAKNKAPRVMP